MDEILLAEMILCVGAKRKGKRGLFGQKCQNRGKINDKTKIQQLVKIAIQLATI